MIKIGTHNSVFHADDSFACATLKRVIPDAQIVRTRDVKILATCDIRIDVGGKNDVVTSDYDHHQKGGAGVRTNGVPYASFGLVWKQYGATICGSQKVANIVERNLVAPVDAADCGFALWSADQVAVPYTVSHLISSMNPSWQENGDFDGAFQKAVEIATLVLNREITRAQGVVLAESLVQKAIEDAEDPRFVILSRFAPWQEAFFATTSPAVYVLFPDPDGQWRVQSIPSQLGSFEQRKPLPQSWAGKRDNELQTLTGVSDAVFCHPGRFICGAKSLEGVKALARLACEA